MSSPAGRLVAGSMALDGDLARREALARRVRWLVGATISYNVVEAIVALSAGRASDSTALMGFGLDSVIEVSSAAAVAWQFSARDHEVREAREHRALRIIAISFFALATYVVVESVRSLAGAGHAEESVVGLALAAVSLLVMPALSAAQRRAGRQLGSASAVADSKQTLLCAYLSAVLLIGLGLNAAFGWAWADPVAALVIAGIAVREGVSAWRGEMCCPPAQGSLSPEPECRESGSPVGCDCDCRDGVTETSAARMIGREEGLGLSRGEPAR